MGEKKTIGALVVGGQANAGPPLGPSLGPLGVNVMAIVKQINDSTSAYAGMRVPVRIIVDTDTKQFEVEVGVPTASALIAKESGIAKGSGTPHTTFTGNLSMAQVAKIASARLPKSYGSSIKSVAKEVIGSCVSMGVKVENKDPRQLYSEIEEGKWDEILSKE